MSSATQTSPSSTPNMPTPWVIYRTLVGVGMLCALFIVSVFELTGPSIEQNRAAAIKKAIYTVLPGAISKQIYQMNHHSEFALYNAKDNTADFVYAGFDEQQQLVGVAILTQGRGYQDRIRIMYGYAPDKQRIIGLVVLESRETPGLGDKIETDASFVSNFKDLDVRIDENMNALLNDLVLVKSGQKKHAWQIDGITGATISSQAITDMLRTSSNKWLPLIQQNRDVFVQQEVEQNE